MSNEIPDDHTDAQIRSALAADGILYVEATGHEDEVKFEFFEYTIPGYAPMKWNITLARFLLRKSEAARAMRTPLTPELMREFLAHVEINPAQVDRADISRPGIAAPYTVNGDTCYMIIDGAHRIAKALKLAQPFYVDVLTDEAAQKCYQGPRQLVPWTATGQVRTPPPAAFPRLPDPEYQSQVQRPPATKEGW